MISFFTNIPFDDVIITWYDPEVRIPESMFKDEPLTKCSESYRSCPNWLTHCTTIAWFDNVVNSIEKRPLLGFGKICHASVGTSLMETDIPSCNIVSSVHPLELVICTW